MTPEGVIFAQVARKDVEHKAPLPTRIAWSAEAMAESINILFTGMQEQRRLSREAHALCNILTGGFDWQVRTADG